MTWNEFDRRINLFIEDLMTTGYFTDANWQETAGALGEPFQARLELTSDPGPVYTLALVEDPDDNEIYILPAQAGCQAFNLTPAGLYCWLWLYETADGPPAAANPGDPAALDDPELCDLCLAPIRNGRCVACGRPAAGRC